MISFTIVSIAKINEKILIILPSLGTGGTTCSLIAFLQNVDTSILKVDVFAKRAYGRHKGQLVNCTLLPENIWLSSEITSGSLIKKILCFLIHYSEVCLKMIGIPLYRFNAVVGGKQIHSDSYDAVITYQESLCSLLAYIPAKKRIGWIRSDYERYIHLCKDIDETKFYKRIDKVVAVSNFVRQTFTKIHPWYKDIVTIYDFVNVDIIREMAEDRTAIDPVYKKGDFTIVSVGRWDEVKQYEIIPEILCEIKKRCPKDFIVKWYLIAIEDLKRGKSLEKASVKLGVKDNLILIPISSNPGAVKIFRGMREVS